MLFEKLFCCFYNMEDFEDYVLEMIEKNITINRIEEYLLCH